MSHFSASAGSRMWVPGATSGPVLNCVSPSYTSDTKFCAVVPLCGSKWLGSTLKAIVAVPPRLIAGAAGVGDAAAPVAAGCAEVFASGCACWAGAHAVAARTDANAMDRNRAPSFIPMPLLMRCPEVVDRRHPAACHRAG